MVLLFVQILGDFEVNLLLAQVKGKFHLHLVEKLLNIDEPGLEVGTSLDQVFSEFLASLAESALANVALPGREHFLDQVQLEELHAGQHIKQSHLLHPVREGEELGRSSQKLGSLRLFLKTALLLEHLDDTLSRDSEVFVSKLLLVKFHNEVIGTELSHGDWASVAIQELDGNVNTVFGEE